MANGAHGSGYDGPREAIRQLERRAGENDAEHRELWRSQGATAERLVRVETKVDDTKATVEKLERECAKATDVAEVRDGQKWLNRLLAVTLAGLAVDFFASGKGPVP